MPFYCEALNISIESFSSLELTDDEQMDFDETAGVGERQEDEEMDVDRRSPDTRRRLLERSEEGPSGSSSTMGCRSLEPSPHPTRRVLLKKSEDEGPSGSSSTMGCRTLDNSQEEECAQGTPPTPPSLDTLPPRETTPRWLWDMKHRFRKESRTIGTQTKIENRYTRTLSV